MNRLVWLAVMAGMLMAGCSERSKEPGGETGPAGALFIIGGGKRPPEMVRRLISEAGIGIDGFIAVLPMSSGEPDSAFYYTRKQFVDQGVQPGKICNFHFTDAEGIRPSMVDSLKMARLIYIPGGDQLRFMKAVLNTPVFQAVRDAYMAGAVVAGTSAGAAVMSRKMITGNEKRHPGYTGDFRTIEAGNIELAEGLGFLDDIVIDQHFIYRMRMNRLISVVLENPGVAGIGIDEATAILVKGDSAEVVGSGQVVRLLNPGKQFNSKDGLLGGENLTLDLFLPGDRFRIRG